MNLAVAVSSKAAMAIPASLREEVHVEDDPCAVAEYLISLLQNQAHASGTSRGALVDYAERTNWKARWDEILAEVAPVYVSETGEAARISLAVPAR